VAIQRTVRRLPARRQQRMLAFDTPRFVALSFGAGDSGVSIGVLAVLSVLFTLGNHALGRWFDGPPPLGPLGVVASAGVATLAWAAMRAMLAPAHRLAPGERRRALAAVLTRELDVAGVTRAEIETIGCTATRAWAWRADDVVLMLLLECDLGVWLALSGPLVAARFACDPPLSIGHRFTVERLRHTGALLSLTVSGGELAVTPIDLRETTLVADSELWSEHELSAEIAGAIGRASAGYR
jgi:hypothetical protein